MTARRTRTAYLVAVLSTAYLLAIVDRMVLSLLVEPIKSDLHLTDTQIGLLTGLAFGLFYTLMGIPLGRMADRTHRPALAAMGVLLWSLATMASGIAATVSQLFVARVLVGVGEASISPAAYSLIAECVPRRLLGRALSCYMLGTVVGLATAWIAGGRILDWLGTENPLRLPFVRHLAPWQTVFVLVGLPGLIVAPLLLSIPDPRTAPQLTPTPTSTSVAGKPTLSALWNHLRAGRKLYLAHFSGMAGINTYGFALVSWAPAMLHRDFDWPVARTGVVLGTAILALGTIGMLTGGRLVDALAAKGLQDAPMRVLFAGAALLIPIGILGPITSTAWARVLLFVAPAMGLFFAVVACAPVVLQLAAPPTLRGSVSAVYLAVVNIAAYALGPLSVGLMSDKLLSHGHGLALALSLLACLCLPLATLSFHSALVPSRNRLRYG
jgi:MFS family permease